MTMQPRPTVYRGVQMRSRLEARYAAAMDYLGWEWIYEPGAFASQDGQYLPDFKVNSRTFDDMSNSSKMPSRPL